MPNRIIKESICESSGLAECSVFANELFKRLIVYADDYGRFNADTAIMRARVFPRDYETISEEDIVSALAELAGVGKVGFYTPTVFAQGGKKGVYGALPNWNEHQRVRDSKPKCPEPGDTNVNDWYLRRFIPFDMKVDIIERDGFKCRSCGKFLTSCKDARRFAKLGQGLYHIDHIVPVVQGGRATEENLRLTCPECNLKRKKRFSFKEILNFAENPEFAENCGELPQAAATCGLNPIQSNPNPIRESESESAQTNARENAFAEFWDAYPKKVGKKDAYKAFCKLSKADWPKLVPAVEQQKQSKQWQKDEGQFIPNPSTWLNQGRWDDDLAHEQLVQNGPKYAASCKVDVADLEALHSRIKEI